MRFYLAFFFSILIGVALVCWSAFDTVPAETESGQSNAAAGASVRSMELAAKDLVAVAAGGANNESGTATSAAPPMGPTPQPSPSALTAALGGSAAPAGPAAFCEALKTYPKANGEKLSFEAGEVSGLCRPFIKQQARKDLDRCGDFQNDPYVSHFTWASRNEMSKRGKGNLYTDADLQPQLSKLLKKVEDIRTQTARLCCNGDDSCQRAMAKVEVDVCRPADDPDQSDPCVFGGSYRMPGEGYASIFRAIHRLHGPEAASEARKIAERNLASTDMTDASLPAGTTSGGIILSSYVSRTSGIASIEPVIYHEFGHACSMIKMQQASITKGSESGDRALRATQWLDRARTRCNPDLELPEAYFDFWESVGESRGLAQCLVDLTKANQKQLIDKPCAGLCPGHYLEEAVGVAFSLLLGDLKGNPESVFPNTCDHVRDGQHPMVSDVVDCLAQHSPRFRENLKRSYNCR